MSITRNSNSTDKPEVDGALISLTPLHQCSVLLVFRGILKLHRTKRSRNKDVRSGDRILNLLHKGRTLPDCAIFAPLPSRNFLAYFLQAAAKFDSFRRTTKIASTNIVKTRKWRHKLTVASVADLEAFGVKWSVASEDDFYRPSVHFQGTLSWAYETTPGGLTRSVTNFCFKLHEIKFLTRARILKLKRKINNFYVTHCRWYNRGNGIFSLLRDTWSIYRERSPMSSWNKICLVNNSSEFFGLFSEMDDVLVQTAILL